MPCQKRRRLPHGFCVLAAELVTLADDADGSLSQNDNGICTRGLEPEDGIVHNGKLGVVGGDLDPLIGQKLGSQQVEDGVALAHELDNDLLLRLLDDLQIH